MTDDRYAEKYSKMEGFDEEYLKRMGDQPTPMRAKGRGQSSPIGALVFLLVCAALIPAFVHLLWVIGQWSWRLIG